MAASVSFTRGTSAVRTWACTCCSWVAAAWVRRDAGSKYLFNAAIAVASDGRFLVGPDKGVLSPALLMKYSEPLPGLPPCTGTVTLVALAGTITSGMITLSGISVVTSTSRPPLVAVTGGFLLGKIELGGALVALPAQASQISLGLGGLLVQGVQVAGPAYGELLDHWGDDFLRHGCDLKHTIRLILNSRAYQLRYDPAMEDRFDVAKLEAQAASTTMWRPVRPKVLVMSPASAEVMVPVPPSSVRRSLTITQRPLRRRWTWGSPG